VLLSSNVLATHAKIATMLDDLVNGTNIRHNTTVTPYARVINQYITGCGPIGGGANPSPSSTQPPLAKSKVNKLLAHASEQTDASSPVDAVSFKQGTRQKSVSDILAQVALGREGIPAELLP
jgi:hypothetical protein